ncbi:exopolysaccharide production repressor protein [Allorhizobium undicola]|uniref:exopolysaccharide production repressor protein n=1 Tax=Allorhizobium undicola TaxID=78527 RepID=UPI001FD94C8D|nr:exopolysaccharide production repressor protein [Allorhizobium undicola]
MLDTIVIREEADMMKAPKVFFSMCGVLILFATCIYCLTGSVGSTVVQTILCAVILQLGYFCAVVLLVAKEARERAAQSAGQRREDARSESLGVTALPKHSQGALRNH